MRILTCAALFSALLLTSCNIFFAATPELWVEESGLGDYEMRPTFGWNVRGLDLVRGFRVALDGPGLAGEWIDLDENARSYRTESFLGTGVYTFKLQSKSATGLWSGVGTIEVAVTAVAPYTPNDPLFPEPQNYDPYEGDPVQWNLRRINLPLLWGLIREQEGLGRMTRSDVVVAIVDTGYTLHPDIVDSLDIASGYDFISLDDELGAYYARDGDGIDPDALDEGDSVLTSGDVDNSWHGTAVASIVAASTNNAEGIAGISFPDADGRSYVTQMPVRVLGLLGGTTFDIGQGIAYAAGLTEHIVSGVAASSTPAKIINLSLGAGSPTSPLYADEWVDPILQDAAAAGVVLVAAAGNEREYGAAQTTYPANSPYVLSVGAVAATDEVAEYSNPGTFTGEVPTLDLVAPGGGPPFLLPLDPTTGLYSWYEYVVTASPRSDAVQPLLPADYTYLGTAGTSIAAPHVTAILALLATIDPGTIDLDTARYILRNSVHDAGPAGWDPDYGYGILDALDAYGVFELVRSGAVTVTPGPRLPGINTTIRMSRPDVRPSGPTEERSLIVRFATTTDARVVEAAGIAGVRRVTPGYLGRSRLVVLAPGTDLMTERNRLLARSDVEAVFYNYLYRRLDATRSR